jgi:hypothetical protein
LINIEHHAVLHTIAVGPAKSENLQFTIFIFSPGYGGYFCSADIQADYNGVAIHHPAFASC